MIAIGQRKVTHVPAGFCTKFGILHPTLRIFLELSWVIVMHHFVGSSNVNLKMIVNYEDDHHYKRSIDSGSGFPHHGHDEAFSCA